MRKLVILVLILAAAKVGYQEYLFRAATREVIVSTFQERALQVCQRHTKASVVTAAGTAPVSAWNRPSSVSLMIGKTGPSVYLWQVNSTQWNARYRNPYLLIVAENSASGLACEYDILNGSAQVFKL
jgi:hypothetical protein